MAVLQMAGLVGVCQQHSMPDSADSILEEQQQLLWLHQLQQPWQQTIIPQQWLSAALPVLLELSMLLADAAVLALSLNATNNMFSLSCTLDSVWRLQLKCAAPISTQPQQQQQQVKEMLDVECRKKLLQTFGAPVLQLLAPAMMQYLTRWQQQ